MTSLICKALRSVAQFGAEAIACSPNSGEQREFEVLVNFLPQPRHVDIDHIGLRIKMVTPDVLQQHSPCDYLPGMTHEVLQQFILAGLQVDMGDPSLDGLF